MNNALLSVSEALALVLQQAQPLPPRRVDLLACGGRVLCETIHADADSPPFDRALMDGYAVRAADLPDGVGDLVVVEEIPAGVVPQRTVGAGQAGRIMTGAMLPLGTDAVVPIEVTESRGDRVSIRARRVRAGDNVQRRGQEMQAGDALLTPGRVLSPQDVGLLAGVGQGCPLVRTIPEVVIFSTGDEVVPWTQTPGPGQIRNSNAPMLLAQVARAGGEPRYGGLLADNREVLRVGIEPALAGDVVILSGGVSAGKFDLVPGVLESLGVVAHFHKVALKPGKPLLFGTCARAGQPPCLVFGLPGNPVSSFVCFELFVRSALASLRDDLDPNPWRSQHMALLANLQHRSDRPTFHPARVEATLSGTGVRLVPWAGSADLRGLGAADALAVLPAGEVSLAAGEFIEVIPLGGEL